MAHAGGRCQPHLGSRAKAGVGRISRSGPGEQSPGPGAAFRLWLAPETSAKEPCVPAKHLRWARPGGNATRMPALARDAGQRAQFRAPGSPRGLERRG